MIETITGTIAAVEPAALIVDLHGLGVRVEVTPALAERAGPPGSRVSLLTHLVVVPEQAPRLFGFATSEARALFRLLLSVSGIGPSTALRVLAARSDAAEVAAAIGRGDDEALKVKGVGPKLAKRLVTELKDKVGGLAEAAAWSGAHRRPAGATSAATAGEAQGGGDRAAEEAYLALKGLEFDPEEARRLVRDARKTLPHAPTEELIRAALLRV
jgi:Holliday junction DNA helicase RuvA